MDTYALYCNGRFMVAKPFFMHPTVEDFGVGEIPTSNYKITFADVTPIPFNVGRSAWEKNIPATIKVD